MSNSVNNFNTKPAGSDLSRDNIKHREHEAKSDVKSRARISRSRRLALGFLKRRVSGSDLKN